MLRYISEVLHTIGKQRVPPIYIGLARTVYVHRIWLYGDFPAKNTVYIPYIRDYVWFWPTLDIYLIRGGEDKEADERGGRMHMYVSFSLFYSAN